MSREEIQNLILQAANQSNSVGPLQRNRINRVMTSNFRVAARERITDRTLEALLDDGAIAITPEGAQAAVDIDKIVSAIERLLPVILQILKLFGV